MWENEAASPQTASATLTSTLNPLPIQRGGPATASASLPAVFTLPHLPEAPSAQQFTAIGPANVSRETKEDA